MKKMSVWTLVCRCLAVVFLMANLVACNIISAQFTGTENEDIQGARAAKSALMSSPSINAAPLRVSKQGNMIDLSGYVESEQEKLEAQAIIRKLFPDASINNLIQLR